MGDPSLDTAAKTLTTPADMYVWGADSLPPHHTQCSTPSPRLCDGKGSACLSRSLEMMAKAPPFWAFP